MNIAGLQKLSLVDFPGAMAATVFLAGCNFCCPYCHNAALVVPGSDASAPAFPSIDEEAFWAFLEKRRGVLQGVCITGGEPLLRSGMEEFCARIKSMGYQVKLDTNGSRPAELAQLVEAGLVDYVAMDVKATWPRYAEVTGLHVEAAAPLVEAVQRSAAFLMDAGIDYEFRTTVVRELHDAPHLRRIAAQLQGARAWYLQRYVDSSDVIAGAGTFTAYSEDEMRAFAEDLAGVMPCVSLRGV